MTDHSHNHSHGHRDHGEDNTELTSSNPVLVEVQRGDMIESRHRGSIAVVDAHGRVATGIGDILSPVFARSALKPIQALALIETGAAKAFGLGLAQIALSCASHSGSTIHTELVETWLGKIGCTADDLVCGPSLPWSDYEKQQLYDKGGEASHLHDNCSGKHTAFLTIARHLEYPVEGYNRFDHPVQQRLLGLLEQMTGMDLFDAPKGIDGCGIPVIGIPLANIALAMARLGDPHDQPDERQKACPRIRRAMADEPYLIAGKDRFDTRVLQAIGKSAIVKMGAEGVYCGCFPDLGLGVAIKIDDGSVRAAEAAMMNILLKYDLITERAKGMLLNLLEPPVFSRSGEVVGYIRAAQALQ